MEVGCVQYVRMSNFIIKCGITLACKNHPDENVPTTKEQWARVAHLNGIARAVNEGFCSDKHFS